MVVNYLRATKTVDVGRSTKLDAALKIRRVVVKKCMEPYKGKILSTNKLKAIKRRYERYINMVLSLDELRKTSRAGISLFTGVAPSVSSRRRTRNPNPMYTSLDTPSITTPSTTTPSTITTATSSRKKQARYEKTRKAETAEWRKWFEKEYSQAITYQRGENKGKSRLEAVMPAIDNETMVFKATLEHCFGRKIPQFPDVSDALNEMCNVVCHQETLEQRLLILRAHAALLVKTIRKRIAFL